MVMMANLSLPLRAIRMQVASALNLVVHIERMRDGVRRIQNVSEIAGMEGEVITARELFSFRYTGEKRDGTIDGVFESTRMRPDFVSRAARYGLDGELLDVLGIVGAMRA
jgi:pilus assembly protein CpaF